ncbi:MAG: sugar ABC transporter substrate-binding protein [Thermoleophilia bacterium]|nr:sugar ABC transporter substrate-binding protein [Thermoleophilia bacterium]
MVAVVAVAGCGSDSSSTDSSGSTGSLEGKKVTLVACGSANPWCKVFNDRLVGTLEDKGASVNVLENDFDAVLAVQQANQAIAQNPDLFILYASNDTALIGSVKKAQQAGIPVLYLDSTLDESILDDGSSQVVADNTALGRFAGESMIAGLKEAGVQQGDIAVITGTAGTQMVEDRQAGFEEAMSKAPQYKTVEVQDGDWDGVQSGKIAQQLFAKYGSDGLQGIRTEADYMAVPVIEAAKQAGITVGSKKGDLVVVSTNCSKVGVKSMENGQLFATGTEDPPTQADYTADTAIKQLSGETVPKTVVVPEFKVTRQNLDKHREVCSQG